MALGHPKYDLQAELKQNAPDLEGRGRSVQMVTVSAVSKCYAVLPGEMAASTSLLGSRTKSCSQRNDCVVQPVLQANWPASALSMT